MVLDDRGDDENSRFGRFQISDKNLGYCSDPGGFIHHLRDQISDLAQDISDKVFEGRSFDEKEHLGRYALAIVLYKCIPLVVLNEMGLDKIQENLQLEFCIGDWRDLQEYKSSKGEL
ncbi:MAG: hypothetical protein ACFFCW_22905 [Candidatus Hodarchaeota archaeon]